MRRTAGKVRGTDGGAHRHGPEAGEASILQG